MKAYFKRNDLFKELEIVEGFNFSNLLAEMGYDFCLSNLYADIKQAKRNECKCEWEKSVTCEKCQLDYDRYIATEALLDLRKNGDIVLYRVGFFPNDTFSPSIFIDYPFDRENLTNESEEKIAKLVCFSSEFASFFSFLAIEDDNGNITLLAGRKEGLTCIGKSEKIPVNFYKEEAFRDFQ